MILTRNLLRALALTESSLSLCHLKFSQITGVGSFCATRPPFLGSAGQFGAELQPNQTVSRQNAVKNHGFLLVTGRDTTFLCSSLVVRLLAEEAGDPGSIYIIRLPRRKGFCRVRARHCFFFPQLKWWHSGWMFLREDRFLWFCRAGIWQDW